MFKRAFSRRLAALLAASHLLLMVQVPLAQAAMIDTPEVLQAQQQQVDRQRGDRDPAEVAVHIFSPALCRRRAPGARHTPDVVGVGPTLRFPCSSVEVLTAQGVRKIVRPVRTEPGAAHATGSSCDLQESLEEVRVRSRRKLRRGPERLCKNVF